eukprot:1860180-Alexandrium_andersonii.AAC.1
MLGVIHRTLLGNGPAHLIHFFQLDTTPAPVRERRHARHLKDPCELRCPDYTRRSALGAARLYNMLPDFVISSTSVSSFQSRLQRLVAQRARNECADWELTLTWRIPLWNHPLRALRDWSI